MNPAVIDPPSVTTWTPLLEPSTEPEASLASDRSITLFNASVKEQKPHPEWKASDNHHHHWRFQKYFGRAAMKDLTAADVQVFAREKEK